MRLLLIAGILFSSTHLFGIEGDIQHFLTKVETPKRVKKQIDKLNKKFALDQKESPSDIDQVSGLDPRLLAAIVNIGKQVWKVVEENKPVLTEKFTYANAIPKVVGDVLELDKFSPLQHASFNLKGVNGFGITVYEVVYTLMHRFGGEFEGKGKFLSTVGVIPSKVDVLWGYTVNLDVKQVSIANIGEKVDPVASLGLEVTSQVSTVFKESINRQVFEFIGNKKDALALNL